MERPNKKNTYIFLGMFDSLEDCEKDNPDLRNGYICIVQGSKEYIWFDGSWSLVEDFNFGHINTKEEVLEFIDGFKKDGKEAIEAVFMNGYCFWFARILKERFDGTIVYNPKENHFACAIDVSGSPRSTIFDITGICTLGDTSDYASWDRYKEREPYERRRIYRDCIMKIDPEYGEIDYINNKIGDIKLRIFDADDDD